MQSEVKNPYPPGLEHDFWEMCVRRDLEAFTQNDWSITAADFDASDFLGIHANFSSDPADWQPVFSSLDAYRREFDQQAAEFAELEFEEEPLPLLYKALSLSSPQISGDRATILKSFDGSLPLVGGEQQVLAWKSLFHLKKNSGRWQFTGFVGYLPLD